MLVLGGISICRDKEGHRIKRDQGSYLANQERCHVTYLDRLMKYEVAGSSPLQFCQANFWNDLDTISVEDELTPPLTYERMQTWN